MRVLLTMLGASEFPGRLDLSSPVFAKSHIAVRDWLLDNAHGPMIAGEDCLDLFNSPRSWPDQEAELADWLLERTATQPVPTDLIVHYVGHGGFRDESRDYYLAIRATRADNPFYSSIMVDSLWRTLRSGARRLRRFLIIDACFAAATARALMAPLQEAVKVKVRDLQDTESAQAEREALVGPVCGTAVLCSSSARDPSSMAGVGGITQFTDGLMQVLSTGSKTANDRLSLAQVHTLVMAFVSARYKENAVAPELHAPDQRLGSLQDVPIFPNVAQRVAARVKPITKENPRILARQAESALNSPATSPEILKLWNERLEKAVRDRPLDWRLARVKSLYDTRVCLRLEDAIDTIAKFIFNKKTAIDIDDELADALFFLACYKLGLAERGQLNTPKDYTEVIASLREAIEIRPEIRGWIDSDPQFKRLKTNDNFIRKLDSRIDEASSSRSSEPPGTGADAIVQKTPATSKWYVSYAWGDDRSPEGRVREEIVDRLCAAAAAQGHIILRDKNVLSLGDQISTFMKQIGRGDRVFVILSDKYLHSPYCMFELSEIWRTSQQEGEAFLKRVRIYALPDAKIFQPRDWVDLAIYWKQEYDALESRAQQHGIVVLGEQGHRRLTQMRNFYNQVTDILGILADIVQPRTFEDLERYGFNDLPDEGGSLHSLQKSCRLCEKSD